MDLATARKLHHNGHLEEAERAYRALLASTPGNIDAVHLLGIVLGQLGRLDEAVDRLREAARLSPMSQEIIGNLAGVLGSAGRHAEATEALAAALRLQPDNHLGHENLAVALEYLGRLSEAEAAHREAIRLRPGFAEARCNLGNVLRKLGRIEPALAEYQHAVSLGHSPACQNMASILSSLGRGGAASSCRRRLAELRPDDPAAGSEMLFSLHNLDDISPERMYQEHVRWARRFGEPLYPAAERHAGRLGGPRSGACGRLRIGYVSPDFREYPAARFFLPLLENHDRSKFEVFCYSDVSRPDAITEKIRSLADGWREIADLADKSVDEMIRQDRIDILVDLAGHLSNPRLLLFARKPAPIQVTYIGYPNTTGLRTMDYRFTDAWHDPFSGAQDGPFDGGLDEPRPSGSGPTGSLTLAARSESVRGADPAQPRPAVRGRPAERTATTPNDWSGCRAAAGRIRRAMTCRRSVRSRRMPRDESPSAS